MFQYSAESIQEVMNSIHDALFIHDSETGKIVFANQRVGELYNCTPEEALNISVGKLSLGTPPYSDEDAMRWILKAKTDGEQIFEWLARKKSGETFWTEVALRAAAIDKKKYIIAVVRDISKRKEIEFEQQKTVSQLQAILDACTDVIAIVTMRVFSMAEIKHFWQGGGKLTIKLSGIQLMKFCRHIFLPAGFK